MSRNEIRISQQRNIPKDISVVIFSGGTKDQAKYTWEKRIVEAFKQLNINPDVINKNDVTPENLKKAVENNNVIFFAGPDSEINEILLKTKHLLVKNKIILDCATNKDGFANTLKEIAYNGASVCSTHPMVNPEINPRGQNVILMPIGNKSENATQIAKEIFSEKMEMRLSEWDFEKHSDTMVILQMIPHLVQRVLIDAMGRGLEDIGITIYDVSRYAPANYLIAELGIGRVGIQKPDTSAEFILSALQTEFGKKMLHSIQKNLEEIISASKKKELSNLFTIGINRLDPIGIWKKNMQYRTEVALNRLGNLRSRTCQIDAPNRPGILLEILNILYCNHEIDLTALDSQVINKEDGSSMVHFDIGISDKEINYEKLKDDLKLINCSLNADIKMTPHKLEAYSENRRHL